MAGILAELGTSCSEARRLGTTPDTRICGPVRPLPPKLCVAEHTLLGSDQFVGRRKAVEAIEHPPRDGGDEVGDRHVGTSSKVWRHSTRRNPYRTSPNPAIFGRDEPKQRSATSYPRERSSQMLTRRCSIRLWEVLLQQQINHAAGVGDEVTVAVPGIVPAADGPLI